MPNLSSEFLVFAVPHVFSKLDPQAKLMVRKNYKLVKRGVITGTFVGVGAIDGFQLAKDVVNTKVKAYGYKTFWTVIVGPAIQLCGLPVYIFTLGSRFSKYAIAIINFGQTILKGQMGFADMMWVPVDIALFGECVPYNENCTNATLTLLHNESETVFHSVVSGAILGAGDDKGL